MRFFKRRRPRPQPEPETQPQSEPQSQRPESDLHDRALSELSLLAVNNPRLTALLGEIARGRQRRQS